MKIVKFIFKFITIIVGLIILVGIYSTFIERKLLIVKDEEIKLSHGNGIDFNVVQFSDTHLGEYFSLYDLERVVNKINSLDADIVVFTGDLIDEANKYNQISDISGVLSKIKSKYGKFCIYGNHDYGSGAYEYYSDIMKSSGFQLLVNNTVTININDKIVNISGADDGIWGNIDYDKCMSKFSPETINILLLHEPDLIKGFLDYPIDLTISGHSHGGQVYIPLYGPLVSTNYSDNYVKGLYEIENEWGTRLFVSSGIGNTKVPFRLFNIPEIVNFQMKSY